MLNFLNYIVDEPVWRWRAEQDREDKARRGEALLTGVHNMGYLPVPGDVVGQYGL